MLFLTISGCPWPSDGKTPFVLAGYASDGSVIPIEIVLFLKASIPIGLKLSAVTAFEA